MNSLDSKVEDFTEIVHEPISESQNNHLTTALHTLGALSPSVSSLLTETLFKATWSGLAWQRNVCVLKPLQSTVLLVKINTKNCEEMFIHGPLARTH